MQDYFASRSLRCFFGFAAAILWTGLYLTGFDAVHWLLYLPASLFAFAAITGICPGLIVSKVLFGKQ